MSMAENEEPTGGPHFVGKKDELIKAKRSFRTFEDRDILVLYHQEVFYAIDFHCYHTGGPLLNGDIEDIDGKLCIICPKHKYKISLAKGEGWYKSTNPKEKPPTPRWLSKGVKQRIHTITEIDGDVYVKLSEDPQKLDSDYYQGEKGRAIRAKEAAEAAKEAQKAAS